jgi:hypothetical protein
MSDVEDMWTLAIKYFGLIHFSVCPSLIQMHFNELKFDVYNWVRRSSGHVSA